MDELKPGQHLVKEEFEQPAVEIDEEDAEEIFYECYVFIEEILARKNPQWIQNDGIRLRDKLEEVLNWYRVH